MFPLSQIGECKILRSWRSQSSERRDVPERGTAQTSGAGELRLPNDDGKLPFKITLDMSEGRGGENEAEFEIQNVLPI